MTRLSLAATDCNLELVGRSKTNSVYIVDIGVLEYEY